MYAQRAFRKCSTELSCGIAGINIGPDGSGASAAKTYAAGTETGTTNVRYSAGTIESCSTQPSKTVSGNSSIGGIVGWNLTDGVVKQNTKLCKYHGIRKLRRRDRRKKQRNDPDSG